MALSELSKKEQQAAVRRYLRDLENKIADSIRNAEEASIAVINQPEAANDVGDAGNWYFSNPTTMQQGSAEFKKKWGNRPLTDNWRRASSNSFAGGSGQDDEGGPLLVGGVQVGIASFFPENCVDPLFPGVFTRVSNYLNWINQNMAENRPSLPVILK